MIRFTPERDAVLRRYCAQLSKPLARRDDGLLVFNDGTEAGFSYALAKMDQRFPFSELFDLPWFMEEHGIAAIPLVRAWIDEQINNRARPRRKGPGVHFDE